MTDLVNIALIRGFTVLGVLDLSTVLRDLPDFYLIYGFQMVNSCFVNLKLGLFFSVFSQLTII